LVMVVKGPFEKAFTSRVEVKVIHQRDQVRLNIRPQFGR